VLALLFIYLVLSAQFESFIHPFVIMLSVPLSMTGALFVLWLTGGTLNIYSQVGLVTLVGLITKHGILIVEFSNQLRAKGEDLYQAVIDSATLRLRPILMTTGSHGAGRLAACARHGRRGGIAHADRVGHRRRDVVRHAAHAVRRADGLHAARRQASRAWREGAPAGRAPVAHPGAAD
jgi:multidrug efflux pump subunit AcrB